MFLKELQIDTGDNHPIKADLRWEEGKGKPLIIICHGFLGYKRWGFFPYVSEKLAESGFHVLTMSFSMNGVDEETGAISEIETFARNTISREISDLRRVIEYALEGNLPIEIDKKIGLMGHSRGSAVAIVVASMIREVASLVTWATPSKFDRYTERRKKRWKEEGVLIFKDKRATGPLKLNYSYYEDIDSNRDSFDIIKAVSRLKIPHLMIHGTQDRAVTLKEVGELLKIKRTGHVEFVELKGCSHSFCTIHPMKSPSRCLQEAIKLTVSFFQKTLAIKAKEV